MPPTVVPTLGPPTRPATLITKVRALAMEVFSEIWVKKLLGTILLPVISMPVKLVKIANKPKTTIKITLEESCSLFSNTRLKYETLTNKKASKIIKPTRSIIKINKSNICTPSFTIHFPNSSGQKV